MHPELREALAMSFARYKILHKDKHQPFITETYRGREAQEQAFKNGFSKARFGESLHNFNPCYAADVGFFHPTKGISWDKEHFKRFAVIAKEQGLEWGGDWAFYDGPHLQLPMTLEDARKGRVPKIDDINRWISALARFWRGYK